MELALWYIMFSLSLTIPMLGYLLLVDGAESEFDVVVAKLTLLGEFIFLFLYGPGLIIFWMFRGVFEFLLIKRK